MGTYYEYRYSVSWYENIEDRTIEDGFRRLLYSRVVTCITLEEAQQERKRDVQFPERRIPESRRKFAFEIVVSPVEPVAKEDENVEKSSLMPRLPWPPPGEHRMTREHLAELKTAVVGRRDAA